MQKKVQLLLLGIFVLAWYFNYSYPLLWDDYVYSYVFTAQSFSTSLPLDAKRVTGIDDIIVSQYNHYFSWGGRLVAHTIAQFFLWTGKLFFNIFNALVFLLIILEILWIANKGNVNFDFQFDEVLWTFSLFWIFSVFLSDCLTWLTISCNYLWTTAILLLFLLFYVRAYFRPEAKLFLSDKLPVNFSLFFFGVVAGCTNENTVCFVILILFYFVYAVNFDKIQSTNNDKILQHMIVGLVGLVVGYLFLMLAPGNYNRYAILFNAGILDSGSALLNKNLKTFSMVIFIRFFLYYYSLNRLWALKKNYQNLGSENQKVFHVAIAFLFLSILSLAAMIISPEFRMRSTFASLIFVLVTVTLLRKQNPLQMNTMYANIMADGKVKWIVRLLLCCYVGVTVLFSVFLYTIVKQQNDVVMQQIADEKANQSGQVVVVQERPMLIENHFDFCFFASGGHLPYVYTLEKDENFWINKDVALYYGIKAIRAK